MLSGQWRRIGVAFLIVGKLLAGQPFATVSFSTSSLLAASGDLSTSTTQLLFRTTATDQPSFSLLDANRSVTQTMHMRLDQRHFSGQLPHAKRVPLNPAWLQPAINQTTRNFHFVDHWRSLFAADFAPSSFAADLPAALCRNSELSRTNFDLQPQNERQNYADWLARSGQRVQLPTAIYQNEFDAWLVCGPFNVGMAQRLLLQFKHWLQLSRADDSLFWGVAGDGRNFDGMTLTGHTDQWNTQQILLSGIATQSEIWLGWNFRSRGLAAGEGAWIDQPNLLAYEANDPLIRTCGLRDAGAKGIMLPAYDPTTGGRAPILRSGDTVALQSLLASGVNWVRLDFIEHNGVIDVLAYDRIVDSLCAAGISVLGLINHQTLTRHDFASVASAPAYRQEFARHAAFLAEHFRGRVDAWEVWNEPNYGDGAYIPPDLYAALLRSTADAVRRVNPRAKIVFGGLASAWLDSYEYLVKVYDAWATQTETAAPFDVLALHPYADGWRHGGPHPQQYLKARDRNADDPTILDRFVRLMAERGDADKRIWVTEIGWNSARGAPNSPWCLQQVVVSEREQAEFLKAGFDVLFQDVLNAAVEKVFWYQYMDVGIAGLCHWSSPNRVYDAWYGLYRGDKVTPKPLQCAYRAYPEACPASLGSVKE